MYTFFLKYPEDITYKERFDIILDLYNRFLCDDPNWHFFFEGEEGDIIRVSDEFKDITQSDLKKLNLEFHWREWEDDHEIVNIYKEYFTRIFHENSELVVRIYKDVIKYSYTIDYRTLRNITDRVVHSLFDMLVLPMDFIYTGKKDKPQEVEGHILSMVLADRWYYLGILERDRMLKEYKENN